MSTELLQHYLQYLDQLKKEIEAYPDDASLWSVADGTSNSAGNLAYHLLGNLNHFIGAALGQTGYERNRPLEFTIKDVPRAELLLWLDRTAEMLKQVLPGLTRLEDPFPAGFFETASTVHFQLQRLLAHLAYHTGQVNFHRRLTT